MIDNTMWLFCSAFVVDLFINSITNLHSCLLVSSSGRLKLFLFQGTLEGELSQNVGKNPTYAA